MSCRQQIRSESGFLCSNPHDASRTDGNHSHHVLGPRTDRHILPAVAKSNYDTNAAHASETHLRDAIVATESSSAPELDTPTVSPNDMLNGESTLVTADSTEQF